MTEGVTLPTSTRLITEALLCGLPATLVAGIFLPGMVYTVLTGSAPIVLASYGVLGMLACSWFAMGQYWWLVIRTVRKQAYAFGSPYRIAILCAIATQAMLLFWLPVLVIPGFLVALSAVHFVRVQRRLADEKALKSGCSPR